MPDTISALAAAVTAARATNTALDGSQSPWSQLDLAAAVAVSDEVLDAIGAAGSSFWKLGAVDEPTQVRLGLPGPITAPLVPGAVTCDVIRTTVRLAELLKPKFEPEIGVQIVDGQLLAMPCVEVADSRFAEWRLPPFGVIADAALQGQMLFGIPVPAPESVTVTVSHDSEVKAVGSGSWADAIARLVLIDKDAAPTHVATGSLTQLFDCEPGLWTFDFGPLGRIDVDVV